MFTMPGAQTFQTLLNAESVNGGKVFADANLIDTTNKTVTVHTCEQLLYAFCLNESGSTVYLDPTELSNDIPAQRGFFFQKYEGLKEGVFGGLAPQPGVNFQVADGLDYVIIQGLQITSGYFLRGDHGNTLSNFYFKDCVCTLTNNSFGVFYGAKLTNCKISMHIRQGDQTNRVIDQGTWKSCSCYFEFSDLTPDNLKTDSFLTPSSMSESSIIIRNASYYCRTQADTTISNLTNCSLDMELYKIAVNSNDNNFNLNNINNCFISIKSENTPSSNAYIVFTGTASGVNVVNSGGSGATGYYPSLSSSSLSVAIALSETDCKDYEKLNKWGFFTNTASEPSNS